MKGSQMMKGSRMGMQLTPPARRRARRRSRGAHLPGPGQVRHTCAPMDLRELWGRGRETWPEVDLSEEAFVELTRELPPEDPGEAAELYLACAWVAGLASAGQVMARDY